MRPKLAVESAGRVEDAADAFDCAEVSLLKAVPRRRAGWRQDFLVPRSESAVGFDQAPGSGLVSVALKGIFSPMPSVCMVSA